MWYVAAFLFVAGFVCNILALMYMEDMLGEILHDAGTSSIITAIAVAVLWAQRPWGARGASGATG